MSCILPSKQMKNKALYEFPAFHRRRDCPTSTLRCRCTGATEICSDLQVLKAEGLASQLIAVQSLSSEGVRTPKP